MVEQAGAPRLGDELGAEPDEPAGRDQVLHAHPAGAVVDDLLHAALAEREELRDDAEVVLGHVDGEAVDRLVDLAVDLLGEHLRLADGELEALPAHHLDEHRELQLAAALHLPGVGPLGGQHADAHVADQLAVEAALHEPGGELGALLAGERRGVDADRHRQARLVDVDHGERLRVVGVGERLADRDLRDAGDGDDLAGPDLDSAGDPLELLGEVQLGDLGPLDGAVGPAPGDGLALAEVPFTTRHSASRPT